MADVTADQISQARAAGYSDDEIVSHLASKAPEKFKAAKDAGYSAGEILSHLGATKTATKPTTAAAPEASSDEPGMLSDLASGARHGYNEMVRGVQSSRKNILGSDVDDTPVDPNYKPANVTNGSWNPLKWSPKQIPKLIAEQAPLAATSAASAAVGDLLGPAGAIVGGLAPLAITSAGDNVKARAVARSGDQNAVPNDEDKAIGIGTTLAAAVPGSIMHAPGIGNAVGAGLNGLGRVATNLLTRGAVGAGGGVAQNAITQAGTKIGTDAPFDPSALPEAAVGGAASVSPHVLPAVAAGARAIRMGKYNADPEAAANYATRLQNTGLDLNNIHEAAQAHQKVMADTHGELKAALDKVAQQKTLTPEETNAIASIRRGDQITPKDMEHLTTATANTPDGDNAHFLARALKTGQQAQEEGSFDPKTGWQGSATGGMKNVVRGVFNPWHIGGTLAGLGALAFGMPHVSGAVGGGLIGGLGISLGGARLLDSVTGGSRPAANFARTFADHNAELRKATNPPPVPQQPPPLPQPTNAPWGPRPPAAGPTGPQVPPPAAPPPAAPQFNPMALQMLKKQLATPLPGAPAPPAPPAPQMPEFNPMALQMLKQKLKAGLPPEPQPEPAPPPPEPAKPDISPTALSMLKQKLKAGLPPVEAPPAEAPPAAPALPEFNPTALSMLKQKLKAGLPPEPGAEPAAAPIKISKANGKVKTEAPKAEEAPKATPFEPLDEAQLYPPDISAKAYAVHEASAYGAKSPKYLAKAEHSAQKRIDAEKTLVSQYPEFSHAIKGLVRQLHKIGSNTKERDAAVEHYAAFLSPEAAAAVTTAFK
jgi:hypothetical protein